MVILIVYRSVINSHHAGNASKLVAHVQGIEIPLIYCFTTRAQRYRKNTVVVPNLTSVNLTNIIVHRPWDDFGVDIFIPNYVVKDHAVS